MNCCVNCFADQGLQDRIKSMSINEGECDFCDSKCVPIISCDQLADDFDSLFVFYKEYSGTDLSRNKHPKLLHEHLLYYWTGLFNVNKLSTKNVKHLVYNISTYSIWVTPNMRDDLPVELRMYSEGAVPEEMYTLQWENFISEIKEKNRFFISQTLDLELLESTLTRFAKTYPIGTEFYRARISDEPLKADFLGKPPKNKTSPGRANPIGIPYLYISDQEETTLYETRVSLHESISVGKFILRAPLNVISLKNIANYGPFEIQDRGFEIEEFMLVRPYLLRLEEELSKPVRKQDVNLDYLPTQYLCEFIKSLGFDAVEYRSAMAKGGYNLAVFNDKNLECVSTKHYQVKGLKYDWE